MLCCWKLFWISGLQWRVDMDLWCQISFYSDNTSNTGLQSESALEICISWTQLYWYNHSNIHSPQINAFPLGFIACLKRRFSVLKRISRKSVVGHIYTIWSYFHIGETIFGSLAFLKLDFIWSSMALKSLLSWLCMASPWWLLSLWKCLHGKCEFPHMNFFHVKLCLPYLHWHSLHISSVYLRVAGVRARDRALAWKSRK